MCSLGERRRYSMQRASSDDALSVWPNPITRALTDPVFVADRSTVLRGSQACWRRTRRSLLRSKSGTSRVTPIGCVAEARRIITAPAALAQTRYVTSGLTRSAGRAAIIALLTMLDARSGPVVTWREVRLYQRWQRSAPHLPRDGPGNHQNSSEPSRTRIAGQTLFRGQPRRSQRPKQRTNSPQDGGSSPPRPTSEIRSAAVPTRLVE